MSLKFSSIIKRWLLCTLFLTGCTGETYAQSGAKALLEQGWKSLVKDNDLEALRYFGLAYEKAKSENDTESVAAALLNMGICHYSVSYSRGLEYCFRAMAEYKKLEHSNPAKALEGRSRCLVLVSTIYSRQGKLREAIGLSKEAMLGFAPENDTTGYLGLTYNSLGLCYERLKMRDSSEFYYRLALQERLKTNDYTYLPSSYLSMADIEMGHGNKEQSKALYERSLAVADSTGNKQSQVAAILGLGKWFETFEQDEHEAELRFRAGKEIASSLSDKIFYVKSLENLLQLKKKQGDFKQALAYQEELSIIKDSLNSIDKQKAVKSLEIQFEVSEKDRQLKLIQKQREITLLTNYLLAGGIIFILIISGTIIMLLRRSNKRDKLLLLTKEALVKAVEEQRVLKEQQMQNELEFKESQLSAMTFQMAQKNELMQQLKERMEQDKNIANDQVLRKIVSKGLNHDKEWSDFNAHFESINKNFYARLKLAYPDISPNDLKICALIKLNMSIKEMAGILNISPDSVKTARYRLRKKLQLNTEDNLTDFILSL